MPRFQLAAIGAAVVALYLLRLDTAAGLYVDDAWYMVLAKALAEGDGFTLISSAVGPILPAVPPGFPLLLAPVFAFSPQFPDNVLALKAVSVAAMLGVGIASFRFVSREYAAPRATAGAVALLTVAAPAFVFLATSTVMAECVFTLAQLAMALAVERAARSESSPRSRLWVGLGAVLGVAAFLVRTAGFASLLAGALYLGLRRGWRSAVGFAALAVVCASPWLLYESTHRGSAASRAAHGGSISYSYFELLLTKRDGNASGPRIAPGEFVGRVKTNLINVFGRDMGAVVLPAAYRGAGESGLELVGLGGVDGLRVSSMGGAAPTMAWAWVCSGVVAIGILSVIRHRVTVAELVVAITVAMVMLVPSPTFRYILPLTPFLLFYFLRGIGTIADRSHSPPVAAPGPALRISAVCLLVMLTMEHAQYVWQARNGPQPVWLRDQQQVRTVVDWMNGNLESGHVASTNPGLVYLLTGRLGVGLDGMHANAGRWSAAGVRYAVALRTVQRPAASWGLNLIYDLPGSGLWVAAVQPSPNEPDRK